MSEERLHKVMATSGIDSRRKCEEMIVAGRVQVNGQTVTELGTRVDPDKDRVTVDGVPIVIQVTHLYYKLHKPRGVLSDAGNEVDDRKSVVDFMPVPGTRVYPVGRLDLHSEGLILLTDDGELSHRLTHPRFQHPKTYFVLVDQTPTGVQLTTLREGVDLEDGTTAPAEVRVIEQLPVELRLSKGPNEGVWMQVVLREGKKRQIRHMIAAVGLETRRLVRWSIGPLTLARLELGECVALNRDELEALRKQVGLAANSTDPSAVRRDGRTAGGRTAAASAARGGGARSENRRDSEGNRERPPREDTRVDRRRNNAVVSERPGGVIRISSTPEEGEPKKSSQRRQGGDQRKAAAAAGGKRRPVLRPDARSEQANDNRSGQSGAGANRSRPSRPDSGYVDPSEQQSGPRRDYSARPPQPYKVRSRLDDDPEPVYVSKLVQPTPGRRGTGAGGNRRSGPGQGTGGNQSGGRYQGNNVNRSPNAGAPDNRNDAGKAGGAAGGKPGPQTAGGRPAQAGTTGKPGGKPAGKGTGPRKEGWAVPKDKRTPKSGGSTTPAATPKQDKDEE